MQQAKEDNKGMLIAAAMGLIAGLIGPLSASGKTISFVGVTNDVSDFSASGIGIGSAGYWFPQFDAATPITGAPVDNNDRNALPSWVQPNFDSSSSAYSFGAQVFSKGGQPGYASVVLPNGDSGVSGTIYDDQTRDNSNNAIPRVLLGAGVPSSFLLHVIVDNANQEHDPARRLRARAESSDGVFDVDFDVDTRNAPYNVFNGVPDVYTFRFDGWEPSDFLKLQLNSGVSFESAGIGGILFDVVPEPVSLGLVVPGLLLASRVIRRRG